MTIAVQVVPGLELSESKVTATGTQVAPFGGGQAFDSAGLPWSTIQELMRQWVLQYLGERRSPFIQLDPQQHDGTVWGDAALDLNVASNWTAQCSRPGAIATTQPTNARIIKITSQPDIIKKAIWDNRGSQTPTVFKSDISVSVEDEVASGWDRSLTLGVSTTVGVEVGSEAAGVKAKFEETFSMETAIGRHGEKSHTLTLGSSSGIEKEVPAGGLEVAALSAYRGQLTASVDYITSVGGWICVRWANHKHENPLYLKWPNGHGYNAHTTLVNLEQLMAYGGIKNAFANTQELTCGFYADDKSAVYDVSDTSDATIDHAVFGGDNLLRIRTP